MFLNPRCLIYGVLKDIHSEYHRQYQQKYNQIHCNFTRRPRGTLREKLSTKSIDNVVNNIKLLSWSPSWMIHLGTPPFLPAEKMILYFFLQGGYCFPVIEKCSAFLKHNTNEITKKISTSPANCRVSQQPYLFSNLFIVQWKQIWGHGWLAVLSNNTSPPLHFLWIKFKKTFEYQLPTSMRRGFCTNSNSCILSYFTLFSESYSNLF